MKFEVFADGSGAFVSTEPAAQAEAEKIAALTERMLKEGFGKKRMVSEVERCIAEMPALLDAYELLATCHLMEHKPGKALSVVQKGVAAANKLLPDGFSGRIPWEREGNRPYLGLMRLQVMSFAGMGRHREAAQQAGALLALDPEDGACVRFAAGHEYLRCGEVGTARRLFRDHGAEYPPFWYELGLSLYQERQLVPAATAFRRGIAGNPYIALVLFTGQVPNAFAVPHISWREGPGAAAGYLDTYGELWNDEEQAQRFLYWLFNHSKVLQERAAVMACKEERSFAMATEVDLAAQRRESAVVEAIDDRLSRAILQQCSTAYGPRWPWETYDDNEAPGSIH